MSDETRPSIFSSVLAVLGFIIVLVIIVWGLLHLVSLVRGNSPTSPAATIEVIVPKEVKTGEAFTTTWKYGPSTDGAYAFQYGCNDKVKMTAKVDDNDAAIPCGSSIGITGDSLVLTPTLTGSTTVSIPVTIMYIPTGARAPIAQGSASVNVMSGITTTPKPAKDNGGVIVGGGSSGNADIAVSIISATVDQFGNGTVVFDIANVGSGTSGSYTFNAQLPTATSYNYASPAQSPLAPGAHMQNTLRFSMSITGPITIIVSAADSNQTNNRATQYLNATYGY